MINFRFDIPVCQHEITGCHRKWNAEIKGTFIDESVLKRVNLIEK
jgi:hypothetical protein